MKRKLILIVIGVMVLLASLAISQGENDEEETITSKKTPVQLSISDSKVNHDFGWGSTYISLLDENNKLVTDIFTDEGKFGASINSDVLKRYSYAIKSNVRLMDISSRINENYSIPKFYNFKQNKKNFANEERQIYDFSDVCNNSYSNCSWTKTDYTADIYFTSYGEIDPDVYNLTGCGTLNDTGKTYNLTVDISTTETCFVIGANGITLDFQGHNITGDGGGFSDAGITSSGFNRTTIKNGSIHNFYNGIEYFPVGVKSGGHNITNMKINSSGRDGISLAEDSFITNNLVYRSGFNAAPTQTALTFGNNNTVQGNTVILSAYNGLGGSANNTVTDNTVYSTGLNAITLTGKFNNISNNNLWNCSTTGFITSACLSVSGDSNIINENKINLSVGDGITIGSDHNIFRSTNITNIAKTYVVISMTNHINNTFINMTYKNETVGAGGELIRKWYYQAYVKDSGSNPIENANVTVYNTTRELVDYAISGADGYTSLIELFEYINNATGINYYQTGNYTINATHSDYSGQVINSTYNISESHTVLDVLTFVATPTGAPIISNLANSSTTNESSYISWTTNVNANYTIWIFNDTTRTMENLFDKRDNNTFKTSHNPFWSNLSNFTTYYINLTVANSAGLNSSNNTFSFTTAKNIPETISLIIINLHNQSTTNFSSYIVWNASELSNYTITLYNDSSRTIENLIDKRDNNTFAITHSPFWDNLSNFTTYYINLTVWDFVGNNESNNTFSFTTAMTIPPPMISLIHPFADAPAIDTYVSFVYNITQASVDNASLIIDGKVNGTVDTSITINTNQYFNRFLREETYEWYINGSNSRGTFSSEKRNFTVDENPYEINGTLAMTGGDALVIRRC